MFGEHGLFKDGKVFGMISKDKIYFKDDDLNRDTFIEANLTPFIYKKGKKEMPMDYFSIPDTALEDNEIMLYWAQLGFETSQRKIK